MGKERRCVSMLEARINEAKALLRSMRLKGVLVYAGMSAKTFPYAQVEVGGKVLGGILDRYARIQHATVWYRVFQNGEGTEPVVAFMVEPREF